MHGEPPARGSNDSWIRRDRDTQTGVRLLASVDMATSSIFVGLLSGIGLFLLGMRLMTDGLKLAAGESLKQILGS